jgi:flagellar motor component MotA
MLVRYLIAAIVFTALILVAAFTASGNIAFYFDIPSLIMVVGTSFVLLASTYSFSEMGRAFKTAFSLDAGKEDCSQALAFFTAMRNYLILSGFTGVFLGLIAMLGNLGDASAIGTGMALALITVLYGIYFSLLIAFPMMWLVRKKPAFLRTHP